MTTEQQRQANETRQRRREARRAKNAAEANDRRRAVEVLREIRDNPNAADADRLEAIRMLKG